MSSPQPWSIIGSPAPGTVSALAIGQRKGHTIFAGTRTGIYRALRAEADGQTRWQRLSTAPLEIISLIVSPNYAEDTTILAGGGQGLFISRDGGDQWQAVHTPVSDPVVLCCCFSPNYQSDGIMLAGTLEDGIFYSDSRGERWSYQGFGLLDATVYALAVSPDFAQDETLFAGTESALYYSYNGARAWKLLDFPDEVAPILSLALSPHFVDDHTLFAGTELHGLYQSADRGNTWQQLALPATSVNTLVNAPADGFLYAATDAGLFTLADGGAHWHCLFDRPDAFSTAVSDDLLITGLVDQGAWLATGLPVAEPGPSCVNRVDWQPFFTLPARALTGMELSPRFDSALAAFLYGPQEGIWRTTDGGRSWRSLNEHLPNLDIRSLALSPDFDADQVLVAAAGDSLLMSKTGGDQWSLLAEMPASLVTFAPDGKAIAAASPAGEVWLANEIEGPWQRRAVPWGAQSQVLALALDESKRLRVALLDLAGKTVTIWAGEPGHCQPILSRPASPAVVVRFWIPAQGDALAPWYASVGHQVWELQPSQEGATTAKLVFEVDEGSNVLALTGSRTDMGTLLLACTGQTVYRAPDAKSWTVVHDFGDERAIALALSPSHPDDPNAYALLLGGSFCRVNLKSVRMKGW